MDNEEWELKLREDDEGQQQHISYRDSMYDLRGALEVACEETDNMGDATAVLILQEMWQTVNGMIVWDNPMEIEFGNI